MIKSLEFAHFTNNMHIYGLVYKYYMWSQSEFNFLRLQINITEYTFVYVLRWLLTIWTPELGKNQRVKTLQKHT
jgi:hypothetical protein